MARGLGIANTVFAATGRASGGGQKTAKVGPQPSSSPGNNRRGAGQGASSGGRGGGSRPRGKPARLPPPPPVDPGVAPAGMRRRVSVKTSTKGESPFADLRGGGALLSPAARKDPARAEEERRRLWERLGASATGSGNAPAGFAHLLDPGAKAMTQGSGRGEEGTRARGSSRAVLRVGYTAHREKFARALRLELEEEMARAKERLETWPVDRIRQEGYARCTRGRCKKTPSSESSSLDTKLPVRMPRRTFPPVRMPRQHHRRPRPWTGRGGPSRWAPSYHFTASRRATW